MRCRALPLPSRSFCGSVEPLLGRRERVLKRLVHTRLHDDERVIAADWFATKVYEHLLVRRDISTLGVMVLTAESIAAKLNGTGECSYLPIKRLEPWMIKKALQVLSRKRLISMDNGSGELTLYLTGYFKNQEWGPTVVRSWPDRLREIPSARIRERVRKDARNFCRRKNYSIPRGL